MSKIIGKFLISLEEHDLSHDILDIEPKTKKTFPIYLLAR